MFLNSKLEYKDVSQESPPERQFRNIIGPVFRNNFNLTEDTAPRPTDQTSSILSSSLSPPTTCISQLQGFTNSLIHIGG